MYVYFFVLLPYGEGSLTNSFLSDDGEPHPRRSPSPDADEADEVTEPQETDIDDEEGEDFDEEVNTTSGDFGGRREDLGSVARVGRGEVGGDYEMLGMWDNVASVRNSEGFGVEPVPISQDSRRAFNQ